MWTLSGSTRMCFSGVFLCILMEEFWCEGARREYVLVWGVFKAYLMEEFWCEEASREYVLVRSVI
jgi:hypothetical protein